MKVRLTPYDAKWKEMYVNECELLKDILGEAIIKFEHFGSTSVEGMKAKPVIDMMVLVQDINTIDQYNEIFNSKGYDVAGEWGIKGRRLLRKGGEKRTHHIHIYQYDNKEIERHLVVRDYLRENKEEVKKYNALKESIVRVYEDTKEYRDAKNTYVKKLEKKAIDHYFRT